MARRRGGAYSGREPARKPGPGLPIDLSMDFFGPTKYNHRQLIRDLKQGDEDIAIFALRTIIQLEQKNLAGGVGTLNDLRTTIRQVMGNWPEEVRFYATRALEKLDAIEKAASEPAEEASDADADIDLADLSSDDPRVVTQCLRRIEAQSYASAAAPLRELLAKSTDPAQQAEVIAALAAVGNTQDMFAIKKLQTNPSARVRAACVDAFVRLANDPLISNTMIAGFLEDRDGVVKARAIRHLGVADFAKCVPAIESCMASREVADRAALAEALTEVKTDDTTPYLRKLAEDSEETVRAKLLDCLKKADHPQKVFLSEKLRKDPSPSVRKVAGEVIKVVQTQRLLSMGGFDMQVPDKLKGMTSIEDLQAQEEIDPIDLEHLKHREPAIKLQCLYKIEQRRFEKAYQPVLGLLGTSESEEILVAVLRCLAAIGTNREVDAVMHFLAHSSGAVRAAAARAVEQLGNKTQVIFLLLPMLHDADVEARGTAGRAIQRHPMADIESHLQAMVGHKALGLRARAAHFLTHFSGATAQSLLTRVVADPAPQVRWVLANARLSPEDFSDQLLEKLAGDAEEKIRVAAGHNRAALEKRRRSGGESEPFPGLDALHDIARANAEAAEQAAESAAAARAAATSPDESAMGALVGKVARDLTAQRELANLELLRDNLLEGMGRKLYAMIKRRQIQHAAYDKPTFVIDKYTHLLKTGKTSSEDNSLWGKLSKMAGVQKEDQGNAKALETLRQNFIELGRIAMDLSYKENLIHKELNLEYNEIEEAEKKVKAYSERLA